VTKPSLGQGLTAKERLVRPHAKLFTLGAVALLALLAIAAVAAADKPVTVRAGNLIFTADGGVTPKALSKTTQEPVSLTVQGKIATADGTHPPALIEAVIDTDKAGAIDALGVPTCTQGRLEALPTAMAKKACPDAIVGTGTTDVEISFPESKPIAAHSQLTAFNGGTKGGVTTIYVHAFLTVPIPVAIVTTVKISKEHKGPYGTHSVASVPKIANGAGSVTAFSLTFPKKLFAYKGKKHAYLLAKCDDGSFVAQAEAKFNDGTKVGPAKIVRACTPKG
jgi:hypothetical protein